MSVTRRVFPEAFKREAGDRVATSGLSAGAVAPIQLGLWAIFLVPSTRFHHGDAREFIGRFGRVIEPVESHPAMRANAAPRAAGVAEGGNGR